MWRKSLQGRHKRAKYSQTLCWTRVQGTELASGSDYDSVAKFELNENVESSGGCLSWRNEAELRADSCWPLRYV